MIKAKRVKTKNYEKKKRKMKVVKNNGRRDKVKDGKKQ